MVTLGIVADTHVPDRMPSLPAGLLATFREANLAAILHAGDVCTPQVLQQLAEIAPVHAVRGNRDIFYLAHLPKSLILTYAGLRLGLVHGHGNLFHYCYDKVRRNIYGLEVERYCARALDSFHDVQVVVYGHIHRPINSHIGERLLFNPGSACCHENRDNAPSAGLLHIHAGGQQFSI